MRCKWGSPVIWEELIRGTGWAGGKEKNNIQLIFYQLVKGSETSRTLAGAGALWRKGDGKER